MKSRFSPPLDYVLIRSPKKIISNKINDLAKKARFPGPSAFLIYSNAPSPAPTLPRPDPSYYGFPIRAIGRLFKNAGHFGAGLLCPLLFES